MKVLIACEFSGIVREAFRRRGHDAWSCDLLPTDIPGQHIQGDVLSVLDGGWDMMIAHPPCTYLSNVGVQHLHKDPCRWFKMDDARVFFLKLLNFGIQKTAVENPVPHYYCALPDYDQIVTPSMFGQQAMKKTCLWLRNLPKLKVTNQVEIPESEKYIHPERGKSSGSKWYNLGAVKDRSKRRSRTFQGIADAMAEQWG